MTGYFYKYLPRREGFFREPMLRATPLKVLNDLFEGQFNERQVSEILEDSRKDRAQMNVLPRQPKNDLSEMCGVVQSNLECLGVVSFSEYHLNPLMWSHYADDHQGVVIEFRDDVPLFGWTGKRMEDFQSPRFRECPFDEVFEAPQHVLYRREKPTFKGVPLNSSEYPQYMWNDFNRKILLAKSIDWLYEQELRSILPLMDADRVICENSRVLREYCRKHPELMVKAGGKGKIVIEFPTGFEPYSESNKRGDEGVKAEIYRLSCRSKVPTIFLFRLNPESISAVYFGARSASYESLKEIQENSQISNIARYNVMPDNESFRLVTKRFDESESE